MRSPLTVITIRPNGKLLVSAVAENHTLAVSIGSDIFGWRSRRVDDPPSTCEIHSVSDLLASEEGRDAWNSFMKEVR